MYKTAHGVAHLTTNPQRDVFDRHDGRSAAGCLSGPATPAVHVVAFDAMPAKLTGLVLVGCFLLACGGSSPSSGGTGGSAGSGNGGSGGSTSNGNGGSGSLSASCTDNVIAASSSNGSGSAQAIAFDGTNVYVAAQSFSDNTIRVWSPQGGKLSQVAAIPVSSSFAAQPTALAVDSQASYVEGIPTQTIPASSDVSSSEIGAIFRQPFGMTVSVEPFAGVDNAFYRISPVFVDDGTYLYYMGLPGPTESPEDTLYRIKKGTPPQVPEPLATNFFYATDPQAVLAVDSSYVYVMGGVPDTVGVPYLLRAVPDAPAWDQNSSYAGPADQPLSQAQVVLGSCTSPPLHLEISAQIPYVLCADNSYTQFWIMSVPQLAPTYVPGPGQPADQMLNGKVVTTGTSLVSSFAVAKGYVYYADIDTVYKVPLGGGSSSIMLRSTSVSQLLVGNNTLYVASSCGVQAVGL